MRRSVAIADEQPKRKHSRPTKEQFAAIFAGINNSVEEYDETALDLAPLPIKTNRCGDLYVELAEVDPWETPFSNPDENHYIIDRWVKHQSTYQWAPQPRVTSIPVTKPSPPSIDDRDNYGPITPGAACSKYEFTPDAERILFRYSRIDIKFLTFLDDVIVRYDLKTVRGCRAWAIDSGRYRRYEIAESELR